MALSDQNTLRLRDAVAAVADTFDARFEIVRDAGAGGMGRVYEALDRETGRRVAIKVVERVADQARFVAEAEILERLDHEAIVAYVRHGATGAGEPYLVMDWLVGDTLAARLADKGALTVAETVVFGERIAGALVHAHDAGVVHRDLKPSNVLLVEGAVERATLIDFGVAKTSRDLTHTGQLVGTPGYMAPEQVRGEKSLDGRVDLFALGCVLYEALACRAPFDGAEVMEILARLLLEEPRSIADLVPAVPPRLAALVGALLAKEASHRVADAVIVREELAAIRAALAAGDATALAEPGPRVPQRKVLEGAPTVDARPPRRKRRRTTLAIAGAAVALGGAALLLVLTREDAAPPAPVADPGPCDEQRVDGCAARCAAGDGQACYREGMVLYMNREVPADRAASLAAYIRGCELGAGAACNFAGNSLISEATEGGRTASESYALADRLFQRGCEGGDVQSCRNLGDQLTPDRGKLAPDADRALAVIGKACSRMDVNACLQLRRVLDANHGSTRSRRNAEGVWSNACSRMPHMNCKP